MAQSLTMQGRPTSENSREITIFFEVLMRYGASWPSGRALVSSGRAPLEWSRLTNLTQRIGSGVVAHPGGVVAHPKKSWKQLKLIKFALLPLSLCFLAFKCTMRLFWEGIGLYMLTFEKNNLKNPLYNVFTFAFFLTLFLSWFCPEISFLRRLTPFFLQVDHLMDCGEWTRVVADTFENFLKISLFLQISHDLELKNRVFKSKALNDL